jgi:hypothetical protein
MKGSACVTIWSGGSGYIMPLVPSGFVKQADIAKVAEDVAKDLRPDVLRIRCSLGEDWSGDPAVFFRIVLSDNASKPGRLSGVTRRVAEKLVSAVQPSELGLLPYYNYRSASEQAQLKDEAWD